MSVATVSNLQRITAAKLAEILLASTNQSSSNSTIAIVDVRDDDHIGGHIKSSLHFPSRSLDATMPTLLRKLAGKEVVVFHCALSQQRGPSAALRYLRESAAAAAKTSASSSAAAKAATPEKGGREAGQADEVPQQQKVYVLDRGFVGWQEAYGRDERLTEVWRKELWEDY
ncbi:Rhodanese-like protein [Durotheca rogersii]|uniref:Rhodanese-like protein n=1 Tax=Durotheca rogersii TaxID=419775 RepID=UPI002220186F|nr:Rhodanese-like protein [Durotheca rogersii]KAI5862057.1 Rhodanese-like protein [Durotheca rogersii]